MKRDCSLNKLYLKSKFVSLTHLLDHSILTSQSDHDASMLKASTGFDLPAVYDTYSNTHTHNAKKKNVVLTSVRDPSQKLKLKKYCLESTKFCSDWVFLSEKNGGKRTKIWFFLVLKKRLYPSPPKKKKIKEPTDPVFQKFHSRATQQFPVFGLRDRETACNVHHCSILWIKLFWLFFSLIYFHVIIHVNLYPKRLSKISKLSCMKILMDRNAFISNLLLLWNEISYLMRFWYQYGHKCIETMVLFLCKRIRFQNCHTWLACVPSPQRTNLDKQTNKQTNMNTLIKMPYLLLLWNKISYLMRFWYQYVLKCIETMPLFVCKRI